MHKLKWILFLLVLIVTSCHRIHEGTVVGRRVIPAHTYRYSTMMMVGKVPITTWHTGYVSTKYVLTVGGVSGKEWVYEDFSVSMETYKCKTFGTYFNDTIPCEVYEKK